MWTSYSEDKTHFGEMGVSRKTKQKKTNKQEITVVLYKKIKHVIYFNMN